MIERKKYEDIIRPFVGKNIIKVLVGARRVGKSTLLKLIREELEKQGVSRDVIIHIDFESAHFSEITTADALTAYIAKHVDPAKKHYVFLDEIQELEGWEKALRSFMVDYDIDLYVTGSNARMLSSDLATYITGRYVQIPVFPFSFAEFFYAYQKCGQGSDSRKAFSRYVEQGGFPFQYDLEFGKDASLHYLRDVYSTILLKDIVQKNEFRDTDQLLKIMQYAIQEIGHSFSAKSVSDYFKNERRSVSVDTIYNYLRAAEAACLLYRVGREDAIGKKALRFNEKFYLVDHGIREALGYRNATSIDQVLENIVCMELKRRGYSVTVGKVGEKEIDFIARYGDEVAYYQVAYLLADQKVIEREFSALEAVSDNYPKYVLSLDEFAPARDGIKAVNLIDWLLG